MLLKKGIHIENKYFLVEIVRRDEDIRIVLYDPSVSESFSLKISYEEALELMDGKEDFEYLAGLFRIRDDEIILANGKENAAEQQVVNK